MSPETRDFVIVGGGIIGMSLAHNLLQQGGEVCVVDASASIPPATNAAAGMLAPSFECGSGFLNQRLVELSYEGLGAWREFASTIMGQSNCDIDFRLDGVLGVALTEQDAQELAVRHAQDTHRVGDTQLLSHEDAAALEPGLSQNVTGAILVPDEGQVDPVKTLEALKIACRKLGAVTINDTKAIGLDIENDRVAGVRCSNGNAIATRNLIIASGAQMSLGAEHSIPIVPVKGEAVSLIDRDRVIRHTIRANDFYLCPKSDGRLIIGASEVPGETSLTVADAAITDLKERAQSAVPAISGFVEKARWAGIRPGTPDGAPILGKPSNGPFGLNFAVGHYRNGILLAPITARILTEHLLFEKQSEYLDAFSINRFQA